MDITTLNEMAAELSQHPRFNSNYNTIDIKEYNNGKIGLILNGYQIDGGTVDEIYHSLQTLTIFITDRIQPGTANTDRLNFKYPDYFGTSFFTD